MEHIDIGSSNIACKIFGSGKVDVVIETSLCSCSAEWWHIAEKFSRGYSVLVYDRAGYGTSSLSKLKRTPQNIAEELFQLLSKIEHSEKIVFIGHSQGGLYIQQLARQYPDLVKGLILLDPLSANDNKFKHLLTPEEFKKSGVDKLLNFKIAKVLTSIGLGFLLKQLLKKAPPFYYTKEFSKEAEKYLLTALAKPKQYETAIKEYVLSHEESEIIELKEKGSFPDIPITLITHSSKIYVEEIMHYGGTTKELAEKIERIWQEIMKEYLLFSSKSRFIQAERSGHFIHLTEFNVLKQALDEIMSI